MSGFCTKNNVMRGCPLLVILKWVVSRKIKKNVGIPQASVHPSSCCRCAASCTPVLAVEVVVAHCGDGGRVVVVVMVTSWSWSSSLWWSLSLLLVVVVRQGWLRWW
jgi:hypothetical protein